MKVSQKKQLLMESAELLFYSHGFHAVGVKSILKAANVAPMTMYYHFNSKEEMIIEVLRRREQRYFEVLYSKIDLDHGKESYVESLLKSHIEWLEADGYNGCLFLRAKQEYEGLNEDIVYLTEDHKKKLFNKIIEDANSISDSGKELAVQLVLIIEGLTSLSQIIELEDLKAVAIKMIANI